MAGRLHDDSSGGERGKHSNLGDAGFQRWGFRDYAVERDRGTPLAHNSIRNEVHDARWQGPKGGDHIEAERIEPNDEVVEDKGVKVVIDPKAVLFLLGAEMDFKVDKLAASFVFKNPNETSACGCGESVAITPASPEALAAEG